MSVSVVVLLIALAGAAAAPDLERGQKLLENGDVAGALRAFDAASKADPKDARGPYLRGVALEKKGDVPAAEKAYRESLARDPRFPQAHNNLGALLLGRGE